MIYYAYTLSRYSIFTYLPVQTGGKLKVGVFDFLISLNSLINSVNKYVNNKMKIICTQQVYKSDTPNDNSHYCDSIAL